jgi:hypothetical protein
MPMRRLSFAAAVLALAAACHSPTRLVPSEVFLLTSIDGRPLPTSRTGDPHGPLVLHEELILNGQAMATRNTTVQGSTPGIEVATSVSYAYTRVGDVVTLGNVLCGPGALCVQHIPEQGPIDAAGLTLTPVPSISSLSPQVLVYRRSSFVD